MIMRIRDEKGQAMVLVLILMLIGGLIVAPLLGFMSAGLKAGRRLWSAGGWDGR